MSTSSDKEISNLMKRIVKRDKRIAGLERRCKILESALALHATRIREIPIDVEKAVARGICNVRMIPVGFSGVNANVTVEIDDKRKLAKVSPPKPAP